MIYVHAYQLKCLEEGIGSLLVGEGFLVRLPYLGPGHQNLCALGADTLDARCVDRQSVTAQQQRLAFRLEASFRSSTADSFKLFCSPFLAAISSFLVCEALPQATALPGSRMIFRLPDGRNARPNRSCVAELGKQSPQPPSPAMWTG